MIMLETKTVARKTSDPTMKATREKKTAPLKVPNTRNPSAPANNQKEESFGILFFRQTFLYLPSPKSGGTQAESQSVQEQAVSPPTPTLQGVTLGLCGSIPSRVS